MKTINDMLTVNNGSLGWWSMWSNKMIHDLQRLKAIPARPIDIDYTPTEYESDDGQIWHCQHLSRSAQTEEYYDEYMEAVTGIPSQLHIEYVDVCDECGDVERMVFEDE